MSIQNRRLDNEDLISVGIALPKACALFIGLFVVILVTAAIEYLIRKIQYQSSSLINTILVDEKETPKKEPSKGVYNQRFFIGRRTEGFH